MGNHTIKKRLWHIVICIYSLGLVMANIFRLFNNNFWADEVGSMEIINRDLRGIFQATAADVHPPLYYMILKFFIVLCGDYGWVYRLTSLIPYLITLIFCLTIVRKRWGDLSTILMVTFVSLMPNATAYNIEARMYSWAALFVLLAFYSFLLIIESKSKYRYIFFVLASLGAAYCHYYALIAVGFFYIGLFFLCIRKRITFKTLAIVYVSTILGYLPWAMQLLSTLERSAEDFWATAAPSFLDSILYIYNDKDMVYGCLLVILTIIALINCARRDSVEWLIWGVVSMLGTIMLGISVSALVRPLLVLRYLYPVAPVMWLVTVVALTRMPKSFEIILAVIVVTILVCGLRFARGVRSDWIGDKRRAQTIDMVNEASSEGAMVLTNNAHLDWILMDYYLPGVEYRYTTIEDYEYTGGMDYYLIWDDDLTEFEEGYLSSQGLQVTETNHQGRMGDNYLHLYRLEWEKYTMISLYQ